MENFNALDGTMKITIVTFVKDAINWQNLDNDSFVNAATTWERVLNRLAQYLTPLGASCIHVSEIPLNIRNAVYEYVKQHVRLTVV